MKIATIAFISAMLMAPSFFVSMLTTGLIFIWMLFVVSRKRGTSCSENNVSR